MVIKTIAVGLMTAEEAEWLVPAACAVANTCGAHLIGVHPVEANISYSSATTVISAMSGPTFFDWQIEESAAVEATFERLTQGESFTAQWRGQKIGTLGAADYLTSIARNADLVMMGQPDPDGKRRDQNNLFEDLIRQSGRPVLMIPQGYAVESIGRHILIGWSDTREAARAAHDVLLFNYEGARADVLFVGQEIADDQASPSNRRDLAAALDRHGIKTELVSTPAIAEGVAATLVRQAFEQGCDLIATGAFGHSRAYDFVIGAVTYDIIKRSDIPVLFSR